MSGRVQGLTGFFCFFFYPFYFSPRGDICLQSLLFQNEPYHGNLMRVHRCLTSFKIHFFSFRSPVLVNIHIPEMNEGNTPLQFQWRNSYIKRNWGRWQTEIYWRNILRLFYKEYVHTTEREPS